MTEKKTYKYFFVEQLNDDRYVVRNNKSGDLLGTIEWYPRWSKFVWLQNSNAIMCEGCLDNIQDAIQWAEERRKS